MRYVRRHLLCPLFTTRFVSAFVFRAQQGATTLRRGGLRKGGAVYAVSDFRPDADLAFRNVIAIRFGRIMDGGGYGPPKRMAPHYVRKIIITRLSDLFAMDPVFHVVFP